MQYVIRLSYRTGGEGRWQYVYVNSRGNTTTRKDQAHRFNDQDNAIQVARLLTRNTKYNRGDIYSVD